MFWFQELEIYAHPHNCHVFFMNPGRPEAKVHVLHSQHNRPGTKVAEEVAISTLRLPLVLA